MKKTILLFGLIFFALQFSFGQPAKLDPSFGTNGIVTANLGARFDYSGTAKKVLTQADGSIYLIIQISNQTIITKRHYNGSTDTTYANKGFTAAEKLVTNDAILQPDGKIVLVGTLSEDFAVRRYNTDGTLDNTFSQDGRQSTGLTSYNSSSNEDIAFAAAIQSDGKIVVVGETGYYSYYGTVYRIAIVRYNTDGSLDKSFSGDGIELDDTYTFGAANSVVIQKDQKIVVATGAGNNVDFQPFLVRYKTNGSPDSTFGNNGRVLTTASGEAKSIAMQPDGKIVAMGSNYNVARFNTNGNLDSSFSGDGMQTTDFNGKIAFSNSLVIQSNGKIVVAGFAQADDNANYALVRYNTDGSPDKSFSGDGKQITDFEGKDNIANSLALQTDGKIVAAGSALARYNTNGSLDNTFNKNGRLPTNVQSGYTVFGVSKIQKDGKILTAGQTWDGDEYYSFLVRYNTDGSLDNTFSSNGIRQVNIKLIDVTNDGKIVAVTGNSTVARYNADGSADHSFGKNGMQQNSFTITSMAIQKDGKIVVAGGSYDFTIARYGLDGSLDKSFSEDGKQTTFFYDTYPDSGDSEHVASYASFVVIKSNGEIAVVGTHDPADSYQSSPRGAIAYYNTNGSLDSIRGFQLPSIESYVNGYVSAATIGTNDKIVIVCDFDEHPYGEEKHVFLIGSGFNNDLSLPYGYYSVAVQDDGKIVLGGAVMARYNADGSIDSTFGTNGKQTPAVNINSIAISNNKLYATGSKDENVAIIGAIARYVLPGSSNLPPTVSITTPADNTVRLAPAAHIKLSAAATDADGTITKVEFYNGTTLLHTETVIPYGYVWRNVPLGNYTIYAKAYDNSGLITTSAPVHISVVPNKPPVVSITSPANNQTFADTATILLAAAANDVDGRITRVEFYNGSTLLKTEYESPYRYNWTNVAAGTYTITTVAVDNWGAKTTSAPVTITVTSNTMIVSKRQNAEIEKSTSNNALHIYPNPAKSTVNIYTQGLQTDKITTISVISASGVILKNMQLKGSFQTTKLDVSSLANGVYIIKILNGDKVMYKQFVKL